MTHPAATTLVPMIQANLGDIRMLSIQLFIEKLIERTRHGGGVEQYRIKNTLTDTYITSLAEFKAALSAAQLDLSYPYNSTEGMLGDRITGIEVMPLNLEVQFNPHSSSDEFFSRMYDTDSNYRYRFVFHMAYMNDSVDDAPVMKIFHVRLSRKR